MMNEKEIVELIENISLDTKKMWLGLLSIRDASFSFNPFDVKEFFKTDWGMATSNEMKPFNLIKDALEKARQEADLPFRRFILRLEDWCKNEIKLGKDYQVPKGQYASAGNGYDDALKNIIKKINDFGKKELKNDV